MEIKVLKDSLELAQNDYKEAMPGVWVCRESGQVVILKQDDTGLLVTLSE